LDGLFKALQIWNNFRIFNEDFCDRGNIFSCLAASLSPWRADFMPIIFLNLSESANPKARYYLWQRHTVHDEI